MLENRTTAAAAKVTLGRMDTSSDRTPWAVKSISLIPAMLAQDRMSPGPKPPRACVEHIRSREACRRVAFHGVTGAQPAECRLHPDATEGAEGGRRTGLYPELHRPEPADLAHRQAARHRPGYLESVFLAPPARHRRPGAARRLRGAGRRHPARGSAGATHCAPAQQPRSGWAALSLPPSAPACRP